LKASLDTNVLIHLYKADEEDLLFDFFAGGVCIYEQIRFVELETHGRCVLPKIDRDIACGKIKVVTLGELSCLGVATVFCENVRENKLLYNPEDLGEVYAISLAQTIGAISLVTDDMKQGGPYMSLLHFVECETMPFNFADILILRFLSGRNDVEKTASDFYKINEASQLGWSLKAQTGKFFRRFIDGFYNDRDMLWLKQFCGGCLPTTRIIELLKYVKKR